MPFTQVNSRSSKHLQDIADTLVSAKRVVIITGAGISTSCGIPDFRSRDGLYDLIKDSYDDHDGESTTSTKRATIKGQELFDSNLWRDEHSTRTFYKFIASLRDKITRDVQRTSQTHKFIRKLRDQQKLVRCYTQNIDGLEAREDLQTDLQRGRGNRERLNRKALSELRSPQSAVPGGIHDGGCEVVSLHGDLKNLRCSLCNEHALWTQDRQAQFHQGQPPFCESCATKDMVRKATGKRGLKVGTLRPNIVLYGEQHPAAEAIWQITRQDLKMRPDVLLVMGTSLKVHGLKVLVREFAKAVHDKKSGKVIFVNLTEPAGSVWSDVFDYHVEMDCDTWVKSMVKRRSELWQTQTQIIGQTVKAGVGLKQAKNKHVPAEEQENVNPREGGGRTAQRWKGSQLCPSKGLKRTASTAGIDMPTTPQKRQPLEQLATPISSCAHRNNVVGTDRKEGISSNVIFMAETQSRRSGVIGTNTSDPNDSFLTPEPTPTRKPCHTKHALAEATVNMAAEPLPGTSLVDFEPTRSLGICGKRNLSKEADLDHATISLYDIADPTIRAPKRRRSGNTFTIHEDDGREIEPQTEAKVSNPKNTPQRASSRKNGMTVKVVPHSEDKLLASFSTMRSLGLAQMPQKSVDRPARENTWTIRKSKKLQTGRRTGTNVPPSQRQRNGRQEMVIHAD